MNKTRRRRHGGSKQPLHNTTETSSVSSCGSDSNFSDGEDERRHFDACRVNGSTKAVAHRRMLVPPLEIDIPAAQRMGAFKIRLLWTAILIGAFFLILAAGHFYTSILVLNLTLLIYREVIGLKRNAQKDEKLPLFFFLRWYWFALALYASGYGCLQPLAEAFGLFNSRPIELATRHHVPISYTGAFLGIMLFVASLRRFSLRYQFDQFSLMILTCILVVQQTIYQIANIYNGFIWFFLSSTAVIMNDCFAYIFGMLWGRTRLTRLSPKKTVEGFLGASIVTVVWALVLAEGLSRFKFATCPQRKIDFRPFHVWKYLDCEVNPAFIPTLTRLPTWLQHIMRREDIMMRPFVVHALVLGIFAAFFAPFGGFFASALKRALRVKDFADTIPGHGGITDRFDCQIVMGTFTYLYARTFVLYQPPSVAAVLKLIDKLPHAEKQTLFKVLTEQRAT